MLVKNFHSVTFHLASIYHLTLIVIVGRHPSATYKNAVANTLVYMHAMFLGVKLLSKVIFVFLFFIRVRCLFVYASMFLHVCRYTMCEAVYIS